MAATDLDLLRLELASAREQRDTAHRLVDRMEGELADSGVKVATLQRALLETRDALLAERIARTLPAVEAIAAGEPATEAEMRGAGDLAPYVREAREWAENTPEGRAATRALYRDHPLLKLGRDPLASVPGKGFNAGSFAHRTNVNPRGFGVLTSPSRPYLRLVVNNAIGGES